MKVYQAINAVQSGLAKAGISKDRNNVQQGYKFRGIDDVYNALAPLLASNGLCILPRCVDRACVERVSGKGAALFYVTVKAEFDFVSSEDGSKHTVITYGEAMDTGDKATNKAMSAAYKYACMQAFSIPTEGDNDADSSSHDVRISPVKESLKGCDIDEARVSKVVNALRLYMTEEGKEYNIFEETESLDSDTKLAVWQHLDSKERAKIKKISADFRAAAQ